MARLDDSADVLAWSSEPVAIWYRSPEDDRPHRYFPDFWVRVRNPRTGLVEELLVEVKPAYQTVPPRPRASDGRVPLREALNYAKNASKWAAAEEYCAKRGWRFVKMTELELDIPVGRWKR